MWGGFFNMQNAAATAKNVKINYFEVGKYILYFTLLFTLAKASITPIIKPFAFGLFIALLFSEQNVFILTPLYIVAAFLADIALSSLIVYGAPAIIMALFYILHKRLNKRVNLWLLNVYIVLSQIIYFAYALSDLNVLYEKTVSVIIGVIFTHICIHIAKAIFNRGLRYKLNIDELISLAVVLIALMIGLSDISVAGAQLVRIVVPAVLLTSLYIFGSGTSVILGSVLGLGASFYAGNVSYVAAFSLFVIIASCFKDLNKYMAAASVVLIDVVSGLYFNIYGGYGAADIICVAIGALIFVLLPKSVIDKLSDLLGGIKERHISRHIINRNRISVCSRLYEMSDVFAEMERVFKSMVKGVLTPDQAKIALVKETCEKVCYDCPERVKCWRTRIKETEEALMRLNESALDRGKATLLDLNPYITTYCKRINGIISTINELAAQYRQYVTLTKNMDTSRVLIGDQLGGVSRIMHSLGDETKRAVSFDGDTERRIMEELTYNNVSCREVIVCTGEEDALSITALIRKKDAYREDLSKIVSAAAKSRVMVADRENSSRAGWTAVYLKPTPVFDVIFGQAGAAKAGSGISGDTHSLIKISGDKFMLALCDGMGSGAAAEQMSNTAISLIENFYRAGFDNDIILSGVNKLLSISCEEVFAALDIGVIDLKKGICDFIKLGAVSGYIKTGAGVQIVSGGSLPMGVLDEIRPSITKKTLNAGDILVLVTDGICDAFGEGKLADFIYDRQSLNPQTLAEEILGQAVLNDKGSPSDDMTVVAARVFAA
jgi:stage II sporulation protein E